MPPKITILGDASSATKAFNDAIAGARRLGKETDAVSAGFGRSRIAGLRLRSSIVPMAGGLVVAAQASRQLASSLRVTGDDAVTTEGKLRNAGASLLSGDFVGAIKALAVHAPSSSQKLKALAGDANTSAAALRQFGFETAQDATKTRELADSIKTAEIAAGRWGGQLAINKAELNDHAAELDKNASKALSLAAAMEAAASAVASVGTAIQQAGSDAAAFGERGTLFGRGAGGVEAEARSPGSGMQPFQAPIVGLPQQTKTAIAAAQASPGTSDDVAQYKRAIAELRKQLLIPFITDKDKEEIYSAIAQYTGAVKAIDDQIAADAEKKRRAAEAARKKLAAAAKAALEAMERMADDVKSAVLSGFDTKQSKVNNARALADAKKHLRMARMIGAPSGIQAARRELEDANFAIRRQKLEDMAWRVTAGPKGPVDTLRFGQITININSNQEPEQIAKQVIAVINKRARQTAGQSRGRRAGGPMGVNG